MEGALRRHRLACACAWSLLGCAPFDSGLLDRMGLAAEATQAADAGLVGDAGACGCNLPHAIAGCIAGRCALAQCAPGYLDCNQRPDDGCERTAADAPEGCSRMAA